MLLNQAIATQQSLYSEIQSQIDALQEKQREIQAYLQRLGSVESKMESAAQLLQEAIFEIQNTCPDELPSYQNLITGFFGEKPIAQLEASIEPEPTQDTAPENPTPGDSPVDSTIDSNPVITVTAKVVENQPSNTNIANQEKEDLTPKSVEKDFSRLGWKGLQKLAANHGVSPKGKKRFEIEKELTNLGIKQSAIDKVA